jgi:hypothetical protein
MGNHFFERSVLATSCIFTATTLAQVHRHHDCLKPAPILFWSRYYHAWNLARG